jgi:chitinase
MSTTGRTWRDLSPWRVGVALVVLAATLGGCSLAVRSMLQPLPDPAKPAWFAPYVDLTLTPRFPFEDAAANPAKQVILSFVVADHANPCTPSWGGFYGLDAAGSALDLDRRIARYRSHGGQVIASFGGAVNDELAIVCTDTKALAAAYRSVIDRYDIRTIDLDIEGAALANAAANDRRASAMATLQAERARVKKPLDVWLTLPVASSGLSTEGVGAVDAFVASDAELAGVNVMTMDYGEAPKGTKADMADLTVRSVSSMVRQLRSSYQRADQKLTSAEAWTKIGITPMIGQNDVAGEIFTIDDAHVVLDLVVKQAMPRISMWSLNRDSSCALNVDRTRAWNTCSGLDQTDNQFGWLFATLAGRPAGPKAKAPSANVRTERGAAVDASPSPVDDPASSPYPVWNTDRLYRKDAKVVWRHEVYLAKWWNVGQIPDISIVHEWDSPWRLLGPVLTGEKPTPTTVLPFATYPSWTPDAAYEKATRVQIGGIGYEAKWWTRGDAPGVDVPNAWNSPWSPIAELAEQQDTLTR